MNTTATVICDSISPEGVRLTTMQVTLHRFVLAEFNTHRMFSRSSASSRAIPVTKTLDKLDQIGGVAFPLEWPSEIKGMQGGPPLEGEDLDQAVALLERISDYARDQIREYVDKHPGLRLHKSILNRPLEWFSWHTLCVTSTEWINFFKQRASAFSPLAQPELRTAADLMLEALDASVPSEVGYGEWHLPYIKDEDRAWAATQDETKFTPPPSTRIEVPVPVLCQISAARSARNSYETQEGTRDVFEDIRLFDRLAAADPRHVAPFEMVATPARPYNQTQGNFFGWDQLRHMIQPHTWDQGGRPLDATTEERP